MKMTRTLVAALVCTTMMAAPAMAAKTAPVTGPTIAPEAMATDAPAPANFDPAAKEANDNKVMSVEGIGIEANPIIVIDPGHGGTDPGAVGNGLQEDNLTLDITNKDANKGAVVDYLARHFEVAQEEIATIGDQPNDVLMFRRSGFSIAMGNASDEVKARANAVTDSYNDEGFAKAMEQLILGLAA